MDKRKSESRLSKKALNMGFCIAVAIFGMMFAVSCSKSGKDGNSVTEAIINHEKVDLGLSVKWATCNVGATSPEDYGAYFAWGEIRPKSSYDEENSLTYGKSVSELQSAGIINGEGVLTKAYDAAAANWGGSWRMPTVAEVEELISKCKWEWTQQGDKSGNKVTGPNGNSIFLPAAGGYFGSTLYYEGESGYYWSSTVIDGSNYAFNLGFDDGYHSTDWRDRYRGRSVRAVSE